MRSRSRRKKGISEIIVNLLLVIIVVIFSYFVVSMFLGVMTSGRERVVEQSRESITVLRQSITVLASYIGSDNNLTIILSTGLEPVTIYGILCDSNFSQTLYINNRTYTVTPQGIRLNASSIYVIKIPVDPSIDEVSVMIVYTGGTYDVYAKRV